MDSAYNVQQLISILQEYPPGTVFVSFGITPIRIDVMEYGTALHLTAVKQGVTVLPAKPKQGKRLRRR